MAPPTVGTAFRNKGGTVHVNGVAYSILELLGKGGTSQVFRVLSPDGEVLALKQVGRARSACPVRVRACDSQR